MSFFRLSLELVFCSLLEYFKEVGEYLVVVVTPAHPGQSDGELERSDSYIATQSVREKSGASEHGSDERRGEREGRLRED